MANEPHRRNARPSSVVANAAAATVVVDFAKFTTPRGPRVSLPPIDEYYGSVTELVRGAANPTGNERDRRLLVVELVASVERYVRSVLVALATLCPCSQRVVARKHVSIASIGYYDSSELAFALLDHQALSGQSEITKATQQLLEIDIKQNTSAYAALALFEKVCQLRHAIVHQAGRLGPNNLLEIAVQAPSPLLVAIDVMGFQDLVAICHAAIRAYNQYVFERILERWAREGYVVGEWSKDQLLFERLCGLLVSTTDNPAFVPAQEYPKIWGA